MTLLIHFLSATLLIPITLVLAASPTALGQELSPFEPVQRNADWTPITETIDGIAMVLVPAGCFTMGSSELEIEAATERCTADFSGCQDSWFTDEAPQTEVCFDEPFWIDRTEISNGQYGSEGAFEGDNLPREEITWIDAQAHCESRGGRLPTEAEWEYAARGPNGLSWPWGNEFAGNLLNYCDSNCPDTFADTEFDDGFSDTAPVGNYLASASWVGALDMAGNVLEWTHSIYAPYPYDPADGREIEFGSDSVSERVSRGGSYFFIQSVTRSTSRSHDVPTFSWASTGFRCMQPFE